jgi:diguanylate cyclase (GGDEF)-like protein
MCWNHQPRSFSLYVAVAAASICGYFLLPTPAQNIAFIMSNVVACAAVLVAWRRRGLTPTSGWLLLAAFPAAKAVGNSVYFVNDSILHVQPFPSLGDAAFLCAYLLLAAGLLRLQHARTTGRDLPAVLDTAIITIGFAAASWVVFMAPLLADSSTRLVERVAAVGYPVGDVLVVAVAARFFLTSRRRGPVFAWLAGTVVLMLCGDTIFAILNLMGMYETGHLVDVLMLTYNLGWGAVALHSGAGDLAKAAGMRRRSRSSWWRLATLTAASLIAPLMVIAQILRGHLDGILVTASAAAVLFLLVVGRMVGLVRDLELVLAQRHALESQLQHNAHHDDLTGLVNRRRFTEHVEQALERRPDGGTCVLFIDLDRFKAVNDSLGHAAGDTLLTVTASRLLAALQPHDATARLGGDEFAVLIEGVPSPDALDAIRATLTREIEVPVPLLGLDLKVSASIGTARARPGDTFKDLMHRADIAMYAHKRSIERRCANATPETPQPRMRTK